MKYLSDSLPQTACIPLSFGNEAPEQALGILSPEPSSDEEKREYAKQTAIRHAMSIEDYRLYLSAQNMSENTICLRYPPVFCTIPRNYIFQFEIV